MQSRRAIKMDKVELDPGPVGIDESNFAFLAQDEPLFFQLASAAERLRVNAD